VRDDYWRHGSVCENYAALTAAVLAFGGWADNYMNTVAHLVENAPLAQGIVGPWVHQYPHNAMPGPQIGFLQTAIRWWDRWLKGVDNGAERDPALRAYMLHSAPPDAGAVYRAGPWLAEAEWPSPRVHVEKLPLSQGGQLGGDGILHARVKTPQHLGLHAGEFFPMGLNAEMPGDQAPDDALSVCFDGAPLESPLDLLGAATLTLLVASDQPRAFIVVRLCDVAPDGASTRIAHGMLNLCHRNGFADPELLEPGKGVEATVVLDQMAYRLASGHRLRVALSTSYWPFLWPSPVAATLTLAESMLHLPVHQGSADEWAPPPPEGATPWRHKVLREGRASRRVEHDLISGGIALVVEEDGGDMENLNHGLITGETMAERWSVHPGDPLSARADVTWEQRLARGDWAVRTVATASMWGCADNLHMTARLEAYEGETLIFVRNFDEKVHRRFV
jgi:hypothetical protein